MEKNALTILLFSVGYDNVLEHPRGKRNNGYDGIHYAWQNLSIISRPLFVVKYNLAWRFLKRILYFNFWSYY